MMYDMTAAEFRCTREALGLPLKWLASNLGVTERTIYRWEQGLVPISDYAMEALGLLDEYTSACVVYLTKSRSTKPLTTYTDAIAEVGDDAFPASWHRALTRVAADAAGRGIVYDDEAPVDLPPLPEVDAVIEKR